MAACRAVLFAQLVGYLIKPEAAQAQLEKEQQKTFSGNKSEGVKAASAATSATVVKDDPAVPYPDKKTELEVLKRFFASAILNEHRVGKDAGRIAEEVIQHLTDAIGSEMEITIQIQAHFPNGASEQVIRTITENCKTLKFQSYGFDSK